MAGNRAMPVSHNRRLALMDDPMSDALQLINPTVLAQAEAWRERFLTAQPFRHVVIDDFLTPAFAQSLLAEFPSFERGNYIGDDGKPGGKSTFDKVRKLGTPYGQLDEAIQSEAFLDLIGRMTDVSEPLYDPFYMGGGTHENRHGQGLDAHIDFNYHPAEGWHRRLNLIVYLNHEWEKDWGGSLELFRDPHASSEPDVSVLPLFNRCVIFETTEHSWHGFSPILLPDDKRDLSRKSVALYFYSHQRPAEETAGKHSTVYVNRQLPPYFQPGHTLTTNDVELLKSLLSSRDGYIRMQYDEIAKLLQAHEQGLAGRLTYLAKRLYVRLQR